MERDGTSCVHQLETGTDDVAQYSRERQQRKTELTLRKSIPSTEKSRGILDSIDSLTSGSGMDRPAKNSLFLNTFMWRGIRSPAIPIRNSIIYATRRSKGKEKEKVESYIGRAAPVTLPNVFRMRKSWSTSDLPGHKASPLTNSAKTQPESV